MQVHRSQRDLTVQLSLQLRLNRFAIGIDINQRPGDHAGDQDNPNSNAKYDSESPHSRLRTTKFTPSILDAQFVHRLYADSNSRVTRPSGPMCIEDTGSPWRE